MSSPTLYILGHGSIKEFCNSVQIACVLITLWSGILPRSARDVIAYLKPCVKTFIDGLYSLAVIELVEGQEALSLHLVTEVNHWS